MREFFILGLIILLIGTFFIPNIQDMCINENANWTFHNSIVSGKYITEVKSFPFGHTDYYIIIDGHHTKIPRSVFEDIIPNKTWIGYYINDKNEVEIMRHT